MKDSQQIRIHLGLAFSPDEKAGPAELAGGRMAPRAVRLACDMVIIHMINKINDIKIFQG